MIVYGTKRGAFGKLLLRRWFQLRRSDKNARRDINVQRYRRQWFWNEDRWNQRHGL
jgi:hypothetical protein